MHALLQLIAYFIYVSIIYRYAVTNVLHGCTLNQLMKTSLTLYHTAGYCLECNTITKELAELYSYTYVHTV